jgi:hypothetical protein
VPPNVHRSINAGIAKKGHLIGDRTAVDSTDRHFFFRRSDDESRAQGTSSDTRQPGLLSALRNDFREPLRRNSRRNLPTLYPPPDRSASDSGRRKPRIYIVRHRVPTVNDWLSLGRDGSRQAMLLN